MSLLMPEYERQLRATARRLAGNPAASAAPAGGGIGSRVFLALSSAVAVAIAVLAVVLIGHRGSPGDRTAGAALPAVQYDCGPHEILRTKGPLVPVAHGAAGGQRWTIELDSARHGLRSVQAGRFLLGGRAYGFCATQLDIELVNAGRSGVVYGFAGHTYRPPITVEATTAHGTPGSPAIAKSYPATTRQLPGAMLFLRILPASACAYRGLGVSAPKRATPGGAGEAVLSFTGPFKRACAPGQLRQTPAQGSGPAVPQIAPPAGLPAHARAEYDAGRADVGRAGCLACHQIGDQGNPGPGPDLTRIGAILDPRALEAALLHPAAPMPSYQHLPARERRAIVAFLKELR